MGPVPSVENVICLLGREDPSVAILGQFQAIPVSIVISQRKVDV